MLTSSDEDEMGFIGLRAGAVGYLSKDLDVDILPQALDGAIKGEAAISRRLSMKLIEQSRRAPEISTGMRPVKSPLTAREWEVVDMLYEGQDHRRDRRRAGALDRDHPLAHQEPHEEARRPYPCRGRGAGAPRARRRRRPARPTPRAGRAGGVVGAALGWAREAPPEDVSVRGDVGGAGRPFPLATGSSTPLMTVRS